MHAYTLIPAVVDCEPRSDGSLILRNREPLAEHPTTMAASLLEWSQLAPTRIAVADRKGQADEWRTISYRDFADQSARLAQSLLKLGLSADRPVVVVSENRIEAAVIQFACFRVGIPVAPITAAYSSRGADPARLKTILHALGPGLIIVDHADRHLEALRGATSAAATIVAMEPTSAVITLGSLLKDAPDGSLNEAEARVAPDGIAKILFTSGSTGTPKGAINTHRMLTSNAQAIRQGWPFLLTEPPVVCDWLPWNHVFGSNYVLNTVIGSGGTLYVDDGKPVAEAIRRSVENSAHARPTLHINAPRGLEMVARVLADDEWLARPFFERLGLVFFASAGLPPRVRNHWYALIRKYATRQVHFVSAWGTTETSPLATALNFDASEVNNIGNPVPGTTIKLAAIDGRHELRVKGPNVSPGYLNQPDMTKTMFDEEGYFRTGDVGRLADPARPSAGILIEGRLAEDFKLDSGTWVNVSGLRTQLLELFGPVVRDVVLSGANRHALSALVFLDVDQCHRLLELSGECAALAANPVLLSRIQRAIQEHNSRNSGSSRLIRNYHVMTRVLEAAAGELTEKGTVNHGVVLKREAVLCDALDPPPG